MLTLRPRERRLLVLGVAVALVTVGYFYGVEPLQARHAVVQELIAAREELLARQQRLVTRRARYGEEQEALRAEIAQRRSRLLPGDKPPLAASELQKLVKSTAQETGVEVRSERILPANERGGYTEVPLEVTLSGPIRGLVGFLQRLEAAPVQLSVQDLRLRVVSVAAPRELLATLAVTGYIASGTVNGEPRGRTEPRRTPGS
jgi:type II secretory pathway component PulM